MSGIKNEAGGGNVSPAVVMFLCVTRPQHCLGLGLGRGGEAAGRGKARPMEGLEPGATWCQGLRASPDGGAAWHRCTDTCLLCLGRMRLRLIFPMCFLKQRGHRGGKRQNVITLALYECYSEF